MRATEKPRETLSFDEWINEELPVQYKEQTDILNKAGLLDILSNNEIGITAIDGKEFTLPSFEDIKKEIEENKKIYQIKYEQGFTEFQITPLGLPLERIVSNISDTISKIHNQSDSEGRKKLFPDNNGIMNLQPISLKTEGLDVGQNDEKTVLYYPKTFSYENPSGYTKEDLLKKEHTFPGFLIHLREKNIEIPKPKLKKESDRQQLFPEAEKGKRIGEREQITTYITAENVLKRIKERKEYNNEVGMTPEDFLILVLTHITKTQEGFKKNSINTLLLGAYLPSYDSVSASGNGDPGKISDIVVWPKDLEEYSLGGRTVVPIGKLDI